MNTALSEKTNLALLSRMKEGGFDFSRVHPIEFYAVFTSEQIARQAANRFQGESLNAQVLERQEGGWTLQVSKVMFATNTGIVDYEHSLRQTLLPLGAVMDGWGVTQEAAAR